MDLYRSHPNTKPVDVRLMLSSTLELESVVLIKDGLFCFPSSVFELSVVLRMEAVALEPSLESR